MFSTVSRKYLAAHQTDVMAAGIFRPGWSSMFIQRDHETSDPSCRVDAL